MDGSIVSLGAGNEGEAARAYALSWRAAHAGIVSEAFLLAHTQERMLRALLEEAAKPGRETYVYMAAGRAAGILVVDRIGAEIVKLYVEPASQGRGVGGELLRYGLSRLADQAVVRLCVMNVNAKARAFYERHGFRPSGEETVLNAARGLSELTYELNRSITAGPRINGGDADRRAK